MIDPYAGSGTTSTVCAERSRRSICIDDNPEALKIAKKRLADMNVSVLERRAYAQRPLAKGRQGKKQAKVG